MATISIKEIKLNPALFNICINDYDGFTGQTEYKGTICDIEEKGLIKQWNTENKAKNYFKRLKCGSVN